ncbi:MAG TPA: cytidylate kinase family protein [Clostridiaceae bacterium]|jgi:cytidylate kinase|nr:cytidylate kinase family protein [Clostridiaceae bacterium]
MKKNIITIAGDLASGKSRVTDILRQDLNYEIYRNGEYVRKLAKEKGLNITSFNEYLKDHPEIDQQIEKSAAEYAKTHDNLIVDARLGWYAIPNSFKIYLKVDIDVAAKRAFEDENRKETEKFETIEEQKADMIRRYKLENERFFKLYGVRKEDMSNYDLVVDTTNSTVEKTAKLIEEEYRKWLNT